MDTHLPDLVDTELHEAVRYGDMEDVAAALQQGCDPNAIGVYQWNPLHEASHNGDSDVVRLLLQYKGEPNKQDLLKGNTPVHYAAQEGHLKCLQLLLDSGGLIDVLNNDRQSCVGVAKSICKDLLRKYALKNSSLRETSVKSGPKDDGVEKVFVDRCDSDIKEQLGLGCIHLSFEYHAKKSSLKIRVWELSDLLLPPGNSSLINSIFVKSFMMPDEKKELKRKTEEVKIEKGESHIHSLKHNLSIKHVLTASSFKFEKSLDYRNINDKMIREKSVQLEVYVTQKNSRKRFLIAIWHMPLREAVRKLIKEKFALIPCVNQTIPHQMRLYSASQLNVSNSAQVYYSNPNVRRDIGNDVSDSVSIAVSDVDLGPKSSVHEVVSLPPKMNVRNGREKSACNTDVELSSVHSLSFSDTEHSEQVNSLSNETDLRNSSPETVTEVLSDVSKSEMASDEQNLNTLSGKRCIIVEEKLSDDDARNSSANSGIESEISHTEILKVNENEENQKSRKRISQFREIIMNSKNYDKAGASCRNSEYRKHISNQNRNQKSCPQDERICKNVRPTYLLRKPNRTARKKQLSKTEHELGTRENIPLTDYSSSLASLPQETVISIDMESSFKPDGFENGHLKKSFPGKAVPAVVIDMVDDDDDMTALRKDIAVPKRSHKKPNRTLPDTIGLTCVTKFSLVNESIPLSPRSIDSDSSSLSFQDSGIFETDDVINEAFSIV